MRATNAPASRKRRIRTIKAAKGFRMRRSKLYRYAADALDHGRQYAYRDRKTKKRNYRALWQIRINAAARAGGITYSRFMEGLKAASVELDRKTLADIAATDSAAFTELVGVAQKALKTKQSAAPQAASKEPKAKTAKAKVVTA
jgi:large subunit ribosomal protein L20